MAKFVGRIAHTDLEGGGVILISDQGVTYQLSGAGIEQISDGQRVEIEGRIDAVSVGIAMVGDVLAVQRVRLLG